MKLRKHFFYLVFIFSINSPFYAKAQADTELVDGIYLSYYDLLKNKPSIPNQGLSSYQSDNFRICVQSFKNDDEHGSKKVNPTKVWGFCNDGHVYIQYWHKDYSKYSKNEVFFFKLHRIESLSLFFTQKVSGTNNSWIQPMSQMNQSYNVKPPKIKTQEYVFCFNTGKVLSFSHDFKEIVAIIQKDDQFKNTKIKKKDLYAYISQYNERNPVVFDN